MGVRCDRPHLFEADEDLLEHDPYEEYELDEPPHISLSPDGLKGHVGLHSSGFDDFLLKPELIRGIQECGLEHPSEVQQQCIPHTVLGVDLLCQAKSGMGKTAVFVLAILQQMGPEENHLCALVLCHTRELSYQIHNEFIRFAAHMAEVRVGTYHGGLPCNRHREELTRSRPNIVVGTPGRVKQLALERSLNLKTCRHFVIDECDKMLGKLDMRADIQDIFKLTPHNKQVMMFAATLPSEIRSTCKKFMVHPVEFYVDDDSKLTLHGLTQYHVMLYKEYKFKKLTDLLDALEFNQVAIFVNTRVAAEELSLQLCASGFPSVCMYRGMPQEVRLRVYEQLKHNRAQVLVATDLMGRGVDIDKVDLVVNYDMPVSSQNLGSGVDSYLHRVGRAGRFGTRGLAVTFVSSQEDADVLNQIQERFDTEVQPLPRWMGDDCKVHFVGCSPHRFVQGQDVMIT